MPNKKIALLITGFTTTYKHTFAPLFKIFPREKVDVFLATWDITGYKVREKDDWRDPNKEADYFNVLLRTQQIDQKHLQDAYKPVYMNVEPFDQWESRYAEEMKEIKSKYLPLYFKAWSQWYKVKQGIANIPRQYEIIIWTRFDIRFDTTKETPALLGQIVQNKDKMTCFLPPYGHPSFMYNLFAASNSRSMDKFAKFTDSPKLFDIPRSSLDLPPITDNEKEEKAKKLRYEEALFEFIVHKNYIPPHFVPWNHTVIRIPPEDSIVVTHRPSVRKERPVVREERGKIIR